MLERDGWRAGGVVGVSDGELVTASDTGQADWEPPFDRIRNNDVAANGLDADIREAIGSLIGSPR